MRLPYWMMRWMHRHRLSRNRLRGTWLHGRLGDRLLDKALWKPTRDSLARAWLIGFPITMMPFLPIQSLFACVLAVFLRGNLLLCIALQFLSTPLTAPLQLPACFFVGEVVRGRSPGTVWHQVTHTPGQMLTGDALFSLYVGALLIGVVVGVIGYALLKNYWILPLKRPRAPLPS